MIRTILFPLRFLVFSVGLIAYWMEVASDWLVGARRRTEYVREGRCKRCGRCCVCLALIMPKGLSRYHWMAKLASLWHSLAMNFRFVSEEDGWLVYRCNYYREEGSERGRCSIYPVRHRLCRFFPRQGLFGHPSLHRDCGFRFVKRDVLDYNRRAREEGRQSFREILSRRWAARVGAVE